MRLNWNLMLACGDSYRDGICSSSRFINSL